MADYPDNTPEREEERWRKNLVPNAQRSPEELSAMGRKGGAKAGVTKRRQKTFRESIKAILASDVIDEEHRAVLKSMGLDDSMLNAINVAVNQRALHGDVEAARYLRDTVGERPRDGLEIGNLDDKPLASLDMSKLTDAQLRALAARRAEAKGQPEDDGQ